MAKTRRTRIGAENGHRRVTRACLWILVKETRGYPTGYLRAHSETVEYDRGSRKVGYETAITLGGLWIQTAKNGWQLEFKWRLVFSPLFSEVKLHKTQVIFGVPA